MSNEPLWTDEMIKEAAQVEDPRRGNIVAALRKMRDQYEAHIDGMRNEGSRRRAFWKLHSGAMRKESLIYRWDCDCGGEQIITRHGWYCDWCTEADDLPILAFDAGSHECPFGSTVVIAGEDGNHCPICDWRHWHDRG